MNTLRSKMHIKPESDALYRVDNQGIIGSLFIRSQGARLNNELGNAAYEKGKEVPYHEHFGGYETFLIERGASEVFINGKSCVVERGDLVQVRPYLAHGFRILEENTVWREMFNDMDMYLNVADKRVLLDYSPELLEDKEFRGRQLAEMGTLYREFPPSVQVSKYEMPEVRPYGFGLYNFSLPGLELNLKVGRWETGGIKEIWELVLAKDFRLEWQMPHSAVGLYLVIDGAVHVQADGHDFTARRDEMVNVSPYYRYSLTAVEEGTRLYAHNVRGHLLEALECLRRAGLAAPGAAGDWASIEKVLRQHNCWLTGLSGINL